MPSDIASEQHGLAVGTPPPAKGGQLAVGDIANPAIQTVELALRASTAYQRPDLAVRARQALQRLHNPAGARPGGRRVQAGQEHAGERPGQRPDMPDRR